jgi:hypothetical protein
MGTYNHTASCMQTKATHNLIGRMTTRLTMLLMYSSTKLL